ncbi:carbonic anhydrase [Belnapia sp. T18]|uniref:carbonic anhydrase n=1 Tax=Belnapia arida TaxID=2804533 RepID=A0ABS1UCH2_9PROT|nr:carbonic anhydrase [Belnapia arida]
MFERPCLCCGNASHPAKSQSRRGILASGIAATFAAIGLNCSSAQAAQSTTQTSLTPDQALALLKTGNAEYQHGTHYILAHGRQRRAELAKGQAPFAVLVGCSDSRVSPELLFGRGLGELFIVRNAGNTVDTTALGSIEYGVGVLGCPLVVVLGHEGCGAVAAAMQVVERDGTFPGVIGELVQPIVPAVLAARREDGKISLDDAVVANARRVARRLHTQSPVLQAAISQQRLKIVAARYDLDDGDVKWFEDV